MAPDFVKQRKEQLQSYLDQITSDQELALSAIFANFVGAEKAKSMLQDNEFKALLG